MIINSNFRVFLFLLIAGFAIYANVIPGNFLFDDNLFIENNEHIKSLSNIPKLYYSSVTEGSSVAKDNFYRPNQQALNALLYATFGMNPVPFHIASILFHVINALLIFLLFLHLGIGRNVSFFSSFIFLIHPVNTQAVSYISGMADPLGLMFVLLALLCFILFFEKRNILFAAASVLFFLLGIFTKENTIVFPALALISVIFLIPAFKKIKSPGKLFFLMGTYFFISVSYIYLKFTLLNFSGNIGLTDQENIYTENIYIRIITFLNILPEYFKMIFFPIRLNYEKPYTAFVDFQRPEAIISLLFVLIGTGTAIYFLVKKIKNDSLSAGKSGNGLIFFFSFSWFFICLSPASGIIPVNAMYLEHWLYYPLIGVIFYVGKIYENQKSFAKNVFMIFIIPLCIFFPIRTILRNSEWANSEKFYKNELKFTDKSARMHNNLAMVYADEKKCPLAIQHYKKAIALYDVYPQTHHNLARCYEATGNINEAVNEYFNALLLYPDFTHSHKYLYAIFLNTGDSLRAGMFENFLVRIKNGENINREEITQVINSLKK